MKLVAAMIGVLLCASLAGAEDKPDTTYRFEGGRKIYAIQAEKYLEVKTDNATYRIYPCGQVEKLVWKELNPNEDRPTVVSIPYYGITSTVGISSR